jgi:murein DD-endopeptidase MepM/ murein hydrolase activator NlpD
MKFNLTNILNAKNKISKTKQFFEDPLENILNFIIKAIVSLFIPFPSAAKVIAEYKWGILPVLLNGILLIIVLIISIPFLLSSGNVTKQANANTDINFVKDVVFNSTDIPAQNPLGGQGLSLVKITAGYMDPNYTFFGGVHTGVDFVPDDQYYQSNEIYKKTGDVVVYATLNGTVNYYIDKYGSHTIEITNDENTVKTIDMHLNKVVVKTGDKVTAGDPIGTMGDTGFSTGEHLHYEIRVNNNGTWTTVNPLDYIK